MDTQIKQWLEQRHATWLLCTAFSEAKKKSKAISLQEVNTFFQTLMDYVTRGHMAIHAKLIKVALENNVALDQKLLKNIDKTTDDVLHFNDKYTNPEQLDTWFEDLSHLAERLAHRKAWEDDLMEPYLNATGVQRTY